MNHFQPSFKLREKEKIAGKVKRYYDKPMTPCDHLLSHPAVPSDVKKSLELQGKSVDPLDLLHRIRQQQAVLAALACRDISAAGPGRESLEQFIKQLGEMWRQGEVRATHRTSPKKVHNWRTRKDPFESDWPDILLWLHDKPDATAKELFERLQEEQPGCFPDGQLRTLQRRVRTWRSRDGKRSCLCRPKRARFIWRSCSNRPRQDANSSVTFRLEAMGREIIVDFNQT